MRSWPASSYARPAPSRYARGWLAPGTREPCFISRSCLPKALFQTKRRTSLKKQFIQTVLLGTFILTGFVAPALGQLSTGGIQLPPNYNTFQPPSVGATYVDPVFGSTVKRISNALATPNADIGGNLTWIEDEYPTMTPFNSDNSKILLVHQSYFGLYDGTGFYIRDLPLEISSSSEPRWSRKDNHTIYYVHGNQFKTYDTTSGVMTIVHTFSEYGAISGMGES